jgi:hypothetical protein
MMEYPENNKKKKKNPAASSNHHYSREAKERHRSGLLFIN